MNLSKIREKNKKNTFVNSKIDSGTLSNNDFKKIKDDIFNNFVKPVGYKNLKNIFKI